MKTLLQSSLRRPTHFQPALPDNLSQMLPAGELVQHTLEAVNTFFWAGATGETTFFTRTFNPRVMLTVITYSYAMGLFSSTAIACGCEQDSTLRYLGLGVRFAADRIRVFRGQNSELVKRCLAHVISKASSSAPRTNGAAVGKAIRDLANCQSEAQRRIALAVRLDQMETTPSRARSEGGSLPVNLRESEDDKFEARRGEAG